MRKLLCALGVASALSACGSVAPSTLMRLNTLDPFTADPNDMAVAMEMPAGLDLIPESTKMTFTAVHSPSGETWVGDYTLEEQRLVDGVVIYTLSAADIADLTAAKADLERWRETSDGNSTLSLDVTAKSCRVPESVIGEDPRVSVLLRLEEDGPLRPFLQEAPLSEYFDLSHLAELPQCSG